MCSYPPRWRRFSRPTSGYPKSPCHSSPASPISTARECSRAPGRASRCLSAPFSPPHSSLSQTLGFTNLLCLLRERILRPPTALYSPCGDFLPVLWSRQGPGDKRTGRRTTVKRSAVPGCRTASTRDGLGCGAAHWPSCFLFASSKHRYSRSSNGSGAASVPPVWSKHRPAASSGMGSPRGYLAPDGHHDLGMAAMRITVYYYSIHNDTSSRHAA